MIENKDPLSQLWQEQDVEQADLSQVSKKWRKVRIKQRCYVVLDFLSLLIALTVIWYKFEQIDSFTMMLVLGVMVISVVAMIYITWLRRFSLGWSTVSTDQHIQQLQKQIQNNIKIANLSLRSVWLVVLLLIGFYGSLYYFEVFPYKKWLDKVLFSLAINAVALPAVWIWAIKRKKRFCQELEGLKKMLRGVNN